MPFAPPTHRAEIQTQHFRVAGLRVRRRLFPGQAFQPPATKAGVLALQGDFREHLAVVKRLGAVGREIRLPEDLAAIDALIIPGGESTTIGKLASQFRAAGKKVVIAAGDTFRAAAVEQLQVHHHLLEAEVACRRCQPVGEALGDVAVGVSYYAEFPGTITFPFFDAGVGGLDGPGDPGDEDAACADYLEALLNGLSPDHDEIVRRVRQSEAAAKFLRGET